MAQKRRLIVPACLLAGCLPLLAVAETACFQADGDSGELNFRGVVEGTGFSGFFEDFRVRLCMEEQQLDSAEIEVRVQMAAATVGNREGDEALRGQYMFAVSLFPEAVWRSSSVAASGDGYLAQGQLSLRGISAEQPVNLKLERDGDALWLSGTAEVRRLDFNVGSGEFEDPDFIRNRIDLRFELELAPAD